MGTDLNANQTAFGINATSALDAQINRNKIQVPNFQIGLQ
jgi:hypothetical protein